MSPTLSRLFAEYAADHRHPTNRLTHKVAIPLIVFHIFAMLDWVALGETVSVLGIPVTPSLGHVAWLVAVGVYAWLSPRLAPVMALLFGLCFPIAAHVPAWLVVAVAIVGWTVQLAGHVIYEKNRPSFSKNLLHALVGPLFFVAALFEREQVPG